MSNRATQLLSITYHTALHQWYKLINDGGATLAHSARSDYFLMKLAMRATGRPAIELIETYLLRFLGHRDKYDTWLFYHASNHKQTVYCLIC